MHLNDSIGACRDIEYICSHHEQASAIGAEGYARASGKLSVVVVTSGPGGTNTLTGVIGQWLDSVPVLYLSGQVKQETTIESCKDIGLRQLGDQEINITDIVRPVTKFAAFVRNPHDIGFLLEKAVYMMTHGRPGPVWLDIPLDVQGALVDEHALDAYDPTKDESLIETAAVRPQVDRVIDILKNARQPMFLVCVFRFFDILKKSARPVLLAGQGIRIASAQ
jgi:acetolactate synthase-1/2/3 large subunit